MIHIAGPYVDLVQRCVRCGYVITDNRNAMYPEGQPPPSGWEEGRHISIEGIWPTYFAVVDEPADCETIQ